MTRKPASRETLERLAEGWTVEPGEPVSFRAFSLRRVVLLSELRTLLASQGLSIVDAKDRAVLDKAAVLSRDSLERFGPAYFMTPWTEFAGAELARRGAKP